jgi:hypothetical protein
MTNHCGTCNLCCKLLDVPALSKPANQWCTHCDIGTGCRIYEARPEACRDFECMWLESQREKQPLPGELRPDRCKMMLTFSENRRDVFGYCDPGAPDAWKNPSMLKLLGILTGQGVRVIFGTGRRYFAVDRDRIRPVKLSDPDPDGTRHFERFLDVGEV